ncbi:hypothetical protein [Anianabacter salinae]|uniref:hypothetical protein n=1 Tax=Anianabacter salinae TaxID=2851023 RepID=UPI00225DFED9|nr:hypothetical protein [Anianabacter salinae]MBV0911293.1 hypothetical protein [Anianabacter salinae]
MTRIAALAAVLAALSAPAFAMTQLESQVGAEGLTTSQLAQLKFAQSETGSDATVFFDGESFRFSTSEQHSDRARQIFAQIRAESLSDE